MANEVVFLLRFDTKAGEQQIRQMSTQARAQLTKAFSIAPKSTSLSDALGIKTAVSDVSDLQAAIAKLDLVMNKSARLSDRSYTSKRRKAIPSHLLKDIPVEALGLDEEGIRDRVDAQEARIRDRFRRKANKQGGINTQGRTLARDAAGHPTGDLFSAGGELIRKENKDKLATDEIVRLLQFEAKIRRNQLSQIRRTADSVAQADKERIEARRAEAKAIVNSIRRSARLSTAMDTLRKQSIEAERMRFANGMQGNRAKGGFFGETFDTVRNKQEKGSVESTGDFFRDTRNKQQFEQMVRPFEGSGKAARTARAKEAAREFAEKAGMIRNRAVDPASREGKRFVKTGKSDIKEGESFRSFLPGAHRDPKKSVNNTFGISKTATNLLALSSVLTPLNSQLGAVVMQAGFAAFSLGAPLAALSLLSAAVAGFAGVLKKSAVTAKEAGLETIGFSKATIGLNSEVRMFLNILGVKTQNAFEPVVKELTAMFQELEGLPWEGLVKGAADFTLGLIELSKWLMFIGKYTVLPQGLGKRVPERDKEVNGKKLLAHEGGPRDLRRLLGLEPSVFYTEDKSKENKFRYTPKFDFASIDTLGRDIQRSIFKAESQDPAVRALQAIDVTTRELLQEAKKPETIKESADIVRERTSRMGF